MTYRLKTTGELVTVLADSRVGDTVLVRKTDGSTDRVSLSDISF